MLTKSSDYFNDVRQAGPLLIICFLAAAVSSGALPVYAFGVLTKPLAAEFGWSRLDVKGAVTAYMLAVGVGNLVCGWLIQYVNIRKLMIWSVFTYAANLALMALQPGNLAIFF